MGFYGGCFFGRKRYERTGSGPYPYGVGPKLTNPPFAVYRNYGMEWTLSVAVNSRESTGRAGAATENREDIGAPSPP